MGHDPFLASRLFPPVIKTKPPPFIRSRFQVMRNATRLTSQHAPISTRPATRGDSGSQIQKRTDISFASRQRNAAEWSEGRALSARRQLGTISRPRTPLASGIVGSIRVPRLSALASPLPSPPASVSTPCASPSNKDLNKRRRPPLPLPPSLTCQLLSLLSRLPEHVPAARHGQRCPYQHYPIRQ